MTRTFKEYLEERDGIFEARTVGAKGKNTKIAEVNRLHDIVYTGFPEALGGVGVDPSDILRSKAAHTFTDNFEALLELDDSDRNGFNFIYNQLWDSFDSVRSTFIKLLNSHLKVRQ